jgi:hypothetical protein
MSKYFPFSDTLVTNWTLNMQEEVIPLTLSYIRANSHPVHGSYFVSLAISG